MVGKDVRECKGQNSGAGVRLAFFQKYQPCKGGRPKKEKLSLFFPSKNKNNSRFS
jgi:hypothetical protein